MREAYLLSRNFLDDMGDGEESALTILGHFSTVVFYEKNSYFYYFLLYL